MDLRRFVEKHFSTLLLLPLPWLAFVNASGVASLVRANLPTDTASLAIDRFLAKGAAPFHSTSSDAIVQRNPFDSVTGPLGPHEAEGGGGDDPAPLDAPACDGVRVVAIAASEDPDWSFAALKQGDDPEVALRRRGGALAARTVAYVASDRVWLESRGRLCQIVMFAPEEAPPTAKREVARPSLPSAPSLDPALRQGIHAKSKTEFEVDRGVVERVLTDTAALLGSTRARMESVNGEVAGVRLSGIASTSLLAALGVTDGDRLESINGFDLTKPENALAAYARLREAPHLVLRLNRAGKEVDVTYDIK